MRFGSHELVDSEVLKLVASIPSRSRRVGHCWVWPEVDKRGYSRTKLRLARSPKKLAVRLYRLVATLFQGPIPVGHDVDHVCVNPGCVNPDHLDVVTKARNQKLRGLRRRAPKEQIPLCVSKHAVCGRPLVLYAGAGKYSCGCTWFQYVLQLNAPPAIRVLRGKRWCAPRRGELVDA